MVKKKALFKKDYIKFSKKSKKVKKIISERSLFFFEFIHSSPRCERTYKKEK
jgi:hypothetical protein